MRILPLALLLAAATCKQNPPPDAGPAPSGATPAQACAAMAAVPCQEGKSPNCAAALSAAVADHLNRTLAQPHTLDCLTNAKNANDVHACGAECTP